MYVLLIALFFIPALQAQPPVSLMGPTGAWEFDNGREFPGATGSLAVDPDARRDGKESLKLVGDFTKGGLYVEAGRALDVDIRVLRMGLRKPDAERLVLRIVDASGQCHQINLKIQASPDWQQLTFPLAEFFARRSGSDAVPNVAKYEYWGGANDGKWHGPAKSMHILLSPTADRKRVAMWINDLMVLPSVSSAAATVGEVAVPVSLEAVVEGETDWRFDNGQEFPGAKGSLAVVQDLPELGKASLKLSGDFTHGGAYVETIKDLKPLELSDVSAIRVKYKADHVASIGVRLGDGTGQCHQTHMKIQNDGQWHELVIKPSDVAGGEHWSGANDGKWHGSPAYLSIILGANADPQGKQPVLCIADPVADAIQPAVIQAASFKADFEGSDRLGDDWTVEGKAAIEAKDAFKGSRALRLDRSAEDVDRPCSATGPTFKVAGGAWQIALACKSDLQSPDASFNGTVGIDCLDALGKVIKQIPVAELYGRRNWQPVSKRIELPAGTAAARFHAELHKASGRFWLDELSASQLAAAPRKDHRISRVLFATAQLGNLLLPDDARTVNVTVEATKPLRESQLELSYVVRDYWGAEQMAPGKATLTRAGKTRQQVTYQATIDLAAAPLAVGRYYELHAELPQENDQPFHNYTSLAILPLAPAKAFKPEEIPFTTRNWDNRIGEYLKLSDRLGIRVGGIWGGWSGDSPYKPEAPTIEVCEKLGMGVLTGTPIHAIEYHMKGYEKYDEKALRQGVRNWIEKYGKVRPLIICLGNEPHSTGPGVLENVRAYRAVYEEVKKIDPTVFVLGTSVGPEEEYFKAGFQNYCDAYDFHIYEDCPNVVRAIERYRELFQKYGSEKPIWSTELGLNSQGMTRHAVAVELIKKFTVFFAAGGANVSWFDILYPDHEGTQADSSGQAHNVFDCRYCRYCPKLDAVAYYNAVNAICIKKFAAQAHYDGDVRAYLFRDRDGRSLQVIWKGKGRQDVGVPLPGVQAVQLIAIDGRRSELSADGKGVTLTASEDPVLLLYEGGPATLPERLDEPAARITRLPDAVIKGETASITVAAEGGLSRFSRSNAQRRHENGTVPFVCEVSIEPPPFWQAAKAAGESGTVGFKLAPPATSAAREADLIFPLKNAAGKLRGQLSARFPILGRMTVRVLPEAAVGDEPAAVKLIVRNNAADKQDISWKLAIVNEMAMTEGTFHSPAPAAAYFTGVAEGVATISGDASAEFRVPLAGVDSQTVYRIKATVSDSLGRAIERERFVAGFAAVPRASSAIKCDGNLDEPDWQRAPVQWIREARQYRVIGSPETTKWKGPADLSAKVRYLWDDRCLYVGIEVTDDVFANTKQDDAIWGGDGIQMLVDPARELAEKPGKYDYAMAVGKKGPQAWCYLSASPAAPTGEVKEIVVAAKRATDGSGGMTYEMAIPWTRLAPFHPAAGENFGMSVILNEDDGAGRSSFMNWFGDIQSKGVDFVGDLILGK
jgi:hypothetical protein